MTLLPGHPGPPMALRVSCEALHQKHSQSPFRGLHFPLPTYPVGLERVLGIVLSCLPLSIHWKPARQPTALEKDVELEPFCCLQVNLPSAACCAAVQGQDAERWRAEAVRERAGKGGNRYFQQSANVPLHKGMRTLKTRQIW